MRGTVWRLAGRPFRLLAVQHDALAGAPTVTGLAVTDRRQRAPYPLAVALSDGWWVKTTQVHTVAATDCAGKVATLDGEAMAAVDSALARVLGLTP